MVQDIITFELTESRTSKFFIMGNHNSSHTQQTINDMTFYINGDLSDKKGTKKIGVVLCEEDYLVEMVLQESGTLMITKAKEEHIIKNTKEYRTNMAKSESSHKLHAPKEYEPIVEELIYAFRKHFSQYIHH